VPLNIISLLLFFLNKEKQQKEVKAHRNFQAKLQAINAAQLARTSVRSWHALPTPAIAYTGYR